MSREAYENLVEIADRLKRNYCNDESDWENSPFQWIKGGITSRQKGTIGEQLVQGFLIASGFSVEASPDSDADRVIDGRRVEIKLSTLWSSGIYKFQQVRDQNYDLLFCLGISPNNAHAWVAKKSEIIWNEMSNQHGGQQGRDTWWISFEPPNSPHSWMRPQNGDLSQICSHLRQAIMP